jgi:hypothetical protein
MNYFEINEKLKEELCLNHKAFFAKTIFLSAGAVILPEPFYETTVLWEKDEDMNVIKNAYKIVRKYQKKLKEQMTEAIFEYNTGHPALVWATFTQEET